MDDEDVVAERVAVVALAVRKRRGKTLENRRSCRHAFEFGGSKLSLYNVEEVKFIFDYSVPYREMLIYILVNPIQVLM